MQLNAMETVTIRREYPQVLEAMACREQNSACPQEGSSTRSSRDRTDHSAMYRATSGGVKKAPRAFRSSGVSKASASATVAAYELDMTTPERLQSEEQTVER